MKKIIFLNLIFMIFLKAALADALKTCDTHHICKIGETCFCTIPATSAFNRYFYFTFSPLEADKNYFCHFDSNPVKLFFDEGSTFPSDVTFKCGENCPALPLTLSITTKAINPQEKEFTIKFFVPGSDYPTNVALRCD